MVVEALAKVLKTEDTWKKSFAATLVTFFLGRKLHPVIERAQDLESQGWAWFLTSSLILSRFFLPVSSSVKWKR